MLSDKIYSTSSEEIIKKNYFEIKRIWEENESKIKDLELDISELLCYEMVNKYIELSNYDQVIDYIKKCEQLELLKSEREHIKTKLTFLHQKLCEHPAYFVIQDYLTDLHEEYYTCCCIECEKGLTKKVSEFDEEVLILPSNMNNAYEEYKEYKKEYYKSLRRIM